MGIIFGFYALDCPYRRRHFASRLASAHLNWECSENIFKDKFRLPQTNYIPDNVENGFRSIGGIATKRRNDKNKKKSGRIRENRVIRAKRTDAWDSGVQRGKQLGRC